MNKTPKKVLTPEQKKKRNQKITKHVLIWSAIVAVVATIYWAVIKFVLADYANMTYITFSYVVNYDGGPEEVKIDAINRDKNYPKRFVVPKKLLGRPVTTIGSYAFASLDRLEEVVLPNTIHTLGDGAFYNSKNLKNIVLSENITNVGINAIEGTPYFESFPDGFVTLGQVLYQYKGKLPDNTVLIERDAENENELREAGYNVIEYSGDYANVGSGLFANQPGIVQAYLPKKIPTITEKMFLNNTNLEKVVMGDEVTAIGESAFENTPKLTDININNHAKIASIGKKAFKNSNLTGVVDLPENVVTIEEETFMNNTNMTDFKGGAQVEIIAERAFANTPSLTSFTDVDQVYEIRPEAFMQTGLTRFDVPKQVEAIPNGAFKNSPNLETVTIHDKWYGTYKKYDVLQDKVIQVTGDFEFQTIRAEAFLNDTNFDTLAVRNEAGDIISPLHEIYFSDGIRSLEKSIFKNTATKKVSMGPLLRTLPTEIFADNPQLTAVDFSRRPSPESGKTYSFLTVESRAFRNATALTSLTLPDTTTTISDEAFVGSGLVSFVVPPLVNTINSYTFKDNVNLASVTFPEGLLTIETHSFANCTSLTTLDLPESIKIIHEQAFVGTTNLTTVNIPNTPGVVHDNLAGAFKNAVGLTTFNVPDNYDLIDKNMFEGATALTSVNFTENSKLKRVDDEAFKNTPLLTSITLPNTVTSVGENAFEGNGWYEALPEGLTYLQNQAGLDFAMYKYKGIIPEGAGEIVIPEGVEVIGDGAFLDQTNLTKITLPSTLKHIPKNAFSGAINLQEVVINEGAVVETIENNAFYNTSSLTSFNLPDTVKVIRQRAFNGNTSLETFNINKTSQLQYIEAYAFAGCSSMLEFHIPASIIRIDGWAFQGCTSVTFYVPKGFLPLDTDKFKSNWNPAHRPVVEEEA
jgi:hypothetical protein